MRAALRSAIKVIAIAVISVALVAIWHFQIALRFLTTQPAAINFSKGAWVSCLASPPIAREVIIESVRYDGIVFFDASLEFTNKNLVALAQRKPGTCQRTEIYVQGGSRYFVSFKELNAVKVEGKPVWHNPFST